MMRMYFWLYRFAGANRSMHNVLEIQQEETDEGFTRLKIAVCRKRKLSVFIHAKHFH